MINIEDFKKIEIKIGTVISAEKVPDTDKLLKLIFDFAGEQRQVISGIALAYPNLQILVGRQMAVITNLEPRMIRGLESQGMILAGSDEAGLPSFLTPERTLPSGSLVK